MTKSALKHFIHNDAGAVTVDWVVFPAAIAGLGLGTVASVRAGTGSLDTGISTSLQGGSVASLSVDADPTSGWDTDTATGNRDIGFHYFTDFGVNNWYRNTVENLTNDELIAALDLRRRYMESEMAMGPDDAPSYGEPWGHTDMYNLTLWEVHHRGLG